MEEEQTEKQIEKKEALEFVERLEAANKRTEELQAEQAVLNARNALGGQSEAGTTLPEPKKPARLTDREYAEALERGEVNPLKQDGLI